MIFWQIPVLLRILVANGIAQVLIKKVTTIKGKQSSLVRTKKFFLQFFFCSLIILPIAFASGTLIMNKQALLISLMGIFSGLAAYCQWRAIDISLSKNAIFTFWDDIMAMALAYFFLQESKFWNVSLAVGVVLSLSSMVMFSLHKYYKSRVKGNDLGENNSSKLSEFFIYVAIYSFIWGAVFFFIRYQALKNFPVTGFLAFWFIGTLLAASLILFISKKINNRVANTVDHDFSYDLSRKDIRGVFWLSISIVASLALTFWSYKVAPLTVSQPIFLVGEMILPAFLGLYYFKEIKKLDLKEKLIFSVGIVGGLIVILSF